MTDSKDLTADDIRDLERIVRVVHEYAMDALDANRISPRIRRVPMKLKALARIVEGYAARVEEVIAEREKKHD